MRKRKETKAIYKKHGLMYRITAASMACLLFSVPLVAQTQPESRDDYLRGRVDGERDAKAEGYWFFVGFCTGMLGVLPGIGGLLIAYLVEPSPSTASLIGKSQAYIQGYTEGYQKKGASKQGAKAFVGCGFAAMAWGLFIAVLVAANDE